jgi:hypothetical protein
MRRNGMYRDERGIALITVIWIAALVLGFLSTYALIVRTDIIRTWLASREKKALYCAEAGKEEILANIPDLDYMYPMSLDTTTYEGCLTRMGFKGKYTIEPIPIYPGVRYGSGGKIVYLYPFISRGIVETSARTVTRSLDVGLGFRLPTEAIEGEPIY